MQQDKVEVRAFGVVSSPSANVGQLANILRGMCAHCGQVKIQEVVLDVPLMGGASNIRLRLSRSLMQSRGANSTADRWLIQQEGNPMPGQYANLAGAVRDITDSYVTHANAPEFFIGLGAKQNHILEKSGNEYICHFDGYELQVLVMTVSSQTMGANGVLSKPTQGGKYIVDVRTRIPDVKQAAAASAAIQAFGAKLIPLVTLQPATIPTS